MALLSFSKKTKLIGGGAERVKESLKEKRKGTIKCLGKEEYRSKRQCLRVSFECGESV